MIKELTVGNIRLFAGEDWAFPMYPLTVLCGTNSAGKSTLAKVLLLLRQSEGIRESQGARAGRLRFVGSQVDLGSYRSLVSFNDISRDIVIGISVEDRNPVYLKGFKVTEPDSWLFEKTFDEVPQKCSVKGIFRFSGVSVSNETDDELISLSKHSQMTTRGWLRGADFEITVGEDVILRFRVEAIPFGERDSGRPDYTVILPRDYFEQTGGFRLFYLDDQADQEYVRIDADLHGLMPDRIVVDVRNRFLRPRLARANSDGQQQNWPLPRPIPSLLSVLRSALRNIHYLGPLRAPAKRYYLAQQDLDAPLDPAGEFLPFVLKEQDTILSWFVAPNSRCTATEISLQSALNQWLYYMRTGLDIEPMPLQPEIEISTTKGALVEFEIRSAGDHAFHSLADSGFGYSQILPILVRGLLAAPGSTLIIEQPELHLNPALQVRLAEFFAAMACAGKQVILETHSEHIVNALRVLAAEDVSGKLAELTEIFFLDTSPEGSAAHRLSVKPDGTVPDWPTNFFGEALSLSGRLLRAQRRFRKASRPEGD
ncbi:MAG TPA: AAA family ATPase [Longimicrobium sp.]|jgi:predicted ATPase|uniref:AAA family ATPase n=1 Tax=Longimicrobium sp. TaxID=2029185 RepID=UPI002ED7E088